MKRWPAIAPILWPTLLVLFGDAYALTQYQFSCLVAPQWTPRALGIAVLVGANLLIASSMAWQVAKMALVTRKIRRLKRWDPDAHLVGALPELAEVDLRLVEEDVPLLFTTGGLKPVVVTSRWLLENLDAQELRAAFAHELAHVRHRDALKMLVLQGLCPWGFGLEFLRQSLEQVARDFELRADAIAASRIADPLAVASALVKVGRATRPWAPVMAFADRPALLKERVMALLEGPIPPPEPQRAQKTRMLLFALASLTAWLTLVAHLCVRGLV